MAVCPKCKHKAIYVQKTQNGITIEEFKTHSRQISKKCIKMIRVATQLQDGTWVRISEHKCGCSYGEAT